MSNNYVLGRGRLYFGQHTTPGQVPSSIAELYFGNTPEVNLTIEEEKLDHFSAESGIREKDDSISLEVTRTGTFITDNISPDNLALFFFGEKSTVSVTGASVTGEAIAAVQQGYYYQLGVSPTTPSGQRDILTDSTLVVQDDATVPNTFVETTDYTIDGETGRLYIVPGGGIANDTNLVVDYDYATHTRSRVISGSTAISGSLRYIADNPKGTNRDFYAPYAQISPNGDFALKSEEWAQIPFNIEILKLDAYEALYIDGRPV